MRTRPKRGVSSVARRRSHFPVIPRCDQTPIAPPSDFASVRSRIFPRRCTSSKRAPVSTASARAEPGLRTRAPRGLAQMARTRRPIAQRRTLRAATSTSGSSGMAALAPGRGLAPAAVAGDQLRVLGPDGDEADARAPEAAHDDVVHDDAARGDLLLRAGKRERQVDLGAGNDEGPARSLHGHPRRGDVLGLAELHVLAYGFLHGKHGGHPFRLSALFGCPTPIGTHGFILGLPPESAKNFIPCPI